MKLQFSVPGASREDEERGIAAAMEVFRSTGVSPLTAAEGMFALEGWDDAGFPDDRLTEAQADAAEVWMQAESAAIDACCSDWPEEKRPRDMGYLELVPPEKGWHYG